MSVKVAKVTSATASERELRRDICLGHVYHEARARAGLVGPASNAVPYFFLRIKHAERRDREAQRLVEAMRRNRLGRGAAGVADVAAAVQRRVAVQQLGVPPGFGHADAVVAAAAPA